MTATTAPATFRNRMKFRDIPSLPRAVMAILIIAALVACTPGKASPAKIGDIAGSSYIPPQYGKYILALYPNAPQVAQSSHIPPQYRKYIQALYPNAP